MAILASLAYHDFRDTKNVIGYDANTTNEYHNNTRWAFSLADDPRPSQYLVDHIENSPSLLWGRRENRARTLFVGIIARFQVSFCQTRYKVAQLVLNKLALSNSTYGADVTTKQQCKLQLLQKHEAGKRYNVEWVLTNWHEEKAKIRWHDTDLIIATSGTSEIVLAFAGTASKADALTNIQTLEPASHSGLFDQEGVINSTNSSVEGNIHRGFLNAYSRVVRGNIQKLNGNIIGSNSTKSLDEYFKKCITQQMAPQGQSTAIATIKPRSSHRIRHDKKKEIKRRSNKQVCHSDGNRLMDILRDITATSLRSGHTVHLVGHSLAGALATIHALDIVMNQAHDTPLDRLHLWTFGAPEVADSLFFQSAGTRSPRLRDFFSDGRRYHRYVTQSENNCDTDLVASITSKSLNRRTMRRLGGVRGNVVHTIDPSFLLCNATGGELHKLGSYLGGISSSISSKRTLNTDFPSHMKSLLGEAKGKGRQAV